MTGMTRRGFAGLGGGAGVLACGGLATALPASASGYRPSSRPTARAWRALAASLDGQLIRPHDDRFDRLRLLHNTRFDPFEPRAVVRAAGPGDVAEAIAFARRFGLPLRSRAGGHSYVGDSTVAGGLVVDVRWMRAVRYDGASREAHVGAGVTTGRLARRLAGRGRAVPIGTCPTVGVVGLALGGGLGVDSRRHGLTCDALTGLTLVTADGRVRRVEGGDPLFWASRGGGGGTFGVVTSLDLRTHPARASGVFAVKFRWEDAAAAVRGWADYVQQAPRAVWCNLEIAVDPEGHRLVRVLGRCPPGQQDWRAAQVERAVGRDAIGGWTGRKSFLDTVAWFGGGFTAPRNLSVAGSDVLPGVTDSLAEALPAMVAGRAGSGTGSAVILDPLTGAVQDPRRWETAFPWRRHVAELQWYAALPGDATAADVSAAEAWVGRAHRAVARESAGAYVNRIEPGRTPDDYYAGNLRRLRRIKARVDPSDLFRSPHTIRSG